MEIDPEVAELLGDLPPTKLPLECEAAGWGYNTMREMIQWGQAPPRAPTEGELQPVYDETCVQCGRPITLHRHTWEDHNAKSWCDRGLMGKDEYATNHHVPQREHDLLARGAPRPLPSYVYSKIHVSPAIGAASAAPIGIEPKINKKEVNCSATKHHHKCAHKCSHKDGHFGFHECQYCRKLWR